MRSSKSRSRSKSNRNRSMGNIVNRVFDSSGPEGKVRGTPQQVIDKYNQLARDAQLAGDRVATENFQQHAEHYVRLLNEAQREQQERQQQNQGNQNNNQGGGNQNRGDGGGGQGEHSSSGDDNRQDQNRQRESARNEASGDVMDVKGDDGGSTLVETPESKPRQRRSRKPKGGDQQQQDSGSGDAPTEAAE